MAQDPLIAGVQIPKGATLEKIESSYGPLADNVRCGLVDCGTRHKKGFVVVFRSSFDSSQEQALMGHVCGKREFKETWTKALALHNAQVRKNEARTAIQSFLNAASEVEPLLNAILPGLEARKAIRNILLVDARDFMRECAIACRSQNARVSGFATSHIRHKFKGPLFFLQDEAVARAKTILALIQRMRKISENPDVTAKEINDRLARFKNLRRNFDEIEKEALDSAAALRPAHFAKTVEAIENGFRNRQVLMEGTILFVSRRSIAAGNQFEWVRVADLNQVIAVMTPPPLDAVTPHRLARSNRTNAAA